MTILSFGEIIWDVYPNKHCIGGAPLNFAAHSAKSGADAYLLSAIGDDELGSEALREIQKFNVHTDFIGIVPGSPTGQCIVTLDENAIPDYRILDGVAYDRIALTDEVLSLPFDALAFGTLALRSRENLNAVNTLVCRGNFKKIFCDLNLRDPFYDYETVSFCLKSAHILKISETELEYVIKNILLSTATSHENDLHLLAAAYHNLEAIILTCGENGAYALIRGEKDIYYAPAIPTKVVSTVGAGDSFGATFLVNYLAGEKISVCLERATQRSAYVIAHEDAIPN